jgi:hypothetical protein
MWYNKIWIQLKENGMINDKVRGAEALNGICPSMIG